MFNAGLQNHMTWLGSHSTYAEQTSIPQEKTKLPHATGNCRSAKKSEIYTFKDKRDAERTI